MIYHLDNKGSDDPHINLALEEYCLRISPPNRSYIIIYTNRPSVIIGRHQNIFEEVDLRFAERTRLQIVRRLSGGGTVYHDLGNLNFCFVQTYNRRSIATVRQTIVPVQSALTEMGVSAEFNHKNDLFVGGKKVSGNAQFSNMKRILVHGTLLFNSNLDHLNQALTVKADHISSTARKSAPSRVTNISPYLTTKFGLNEFRRRLLLTIAGLWGGLKTLHLTGSEWHTVEQLAEEKYRSWNWNYGKAPFFQVKRQVPTTTGRLNYVIGVENGRIASIRFDGEMTGIDDISAVEDQLVGTPFHHDAISTRLNHIESYAVDRKLSTDRLFDLFAADLILTS